MRVGPADDAYEREADTMAAQVVSRLAGDTDRDRGAGLAVPALEPVQRRSADTGVIGREGGEIDAHTADTIESARGQGRALPDVARREMEGGFGGADFGAVRLHEGSQSEQLNDTLGARAFKIGRASCRERVL